MTAKGMIAFVSLGVGFLLQMGCNRGPKAGSTDTIHRSSVNFALAFAVNGVPAHYYLGNEGTEAYYDISLFEKEGANTLDVLAIEVDPAASASASIRIQSLDEQHRLDDPTRAESEFKMAGPPNSGEQRGHAVFNAMGLARGTFEDAESLGELAPADKNELLGVANSDAVAFEKGDTEALLLLDATVIANAAKATGDSVQAVRERQRQTYETTFSRFSRMRAIGPDQLRVLAFARGVFVVGEGCQPIVHRSEPGNHGNEVVLKFIPLCKMNSKWVIIKASRNNNVIKIASPI